MPLSMPRWSGLTGSTTADCWNPSETFHQQNEKRRIIVNWRSQVKLPDSNKPVSGITGAVHTVADTGALELTFIEVYRFKDRTCHTVPTNSASGAASQISVSASN